MFIYIAIKKVYIEVLIRITFFFQRKVFPVKVLRNHLRTHPQRHLGVYKCNLELCFSLFDSVISMKDDSISLDF